MKKTIAIALCCLSFGAAAEKINTSKVPATVKTTFSRNYPGIINAKWEAEKGNYEANFRKEGVEMSVLIDPSGNLMETERSISIDGLPAAVVPYMKEHFKGMKITDAAEIIRTDGTTEFEVGIKDNDVIFDGIGNFLREEKD